MKTSKLGAVREMYDKQATSYAQMMDQEIQLPIYNKSLSTLAEHLNGIHGPLVDTSCGTGHLLARYQSEFDSAREIVGIDLSASMVAIARSRLEGKATIAEGDMRDLHSFDTGSLAGAISFF